MATTSFGLPATDVGATGLTGSTDTRQAPNEADPQARFYKYPDNLGSAPFDKWIYFEAKSGRHVMRNTVVSEQNGKDRTISAVGLYLSETAVRSSLTVAYEETALGPLWGAAVEALAQGAQNVTDAIFSPGGSITSTLQALKNGASNAISKAMQSDFKTALGAEAFTLGADLLAQLSIQPG